jgi:Tol biopolymer transport system component
MHRSGAIASAIAITVFIVNLLPAQGPAHRASTGLEGADPDTLSLAPSLSSDGRYAAFQSYASNLVPRDTNGCSDVFVHDRVTGATTRVSVSSSGAEGDGYSGEPAISHDGRFIVFRSDAANLVPGDTNGVADVFVHERITGRTYRVSTGPAGAQPNGPSGRPSISDGGRYVAFESEASNLVPDDQNGTQDVFVRDREALVNTRVSIGPAGEADGPSGEPSIAGDGRTVAFVSRAANLARETDRDADVFLFDLKSKKLTLVSADSAGAAAGGESPVLSRDGSVVVFESAARLRGTDLNADKDVYAYRVVAGILDVASVSSAGAPGRRWLSSRESGPGTSIPADSSGATVSQDGRYVAFVSFARDLVPGTEVGGAEVYVRDLQLGTTRRVTAEGAGAAASAPCEMDFVLGSVECPSIKASISGDGLFVGLQTRGAFSDTDRNDTDDVYVVELGSPNRSAQVKAERKPEQSLGIR